MNLFITCFVQSISCWMTHPTNKHPRNYDVATAPVQCLPHFDQFIPLQVVLEVVNQAVPLYPYLTHAYRTQGASLSPVHNDDVIHETRRCLTLCSDQRRITWSRVVVCCRLFVSIRYIPFYIFSFAPGVYIHCRIVSCQFMTISLNTKMKLLTVQ